MRMQTRLSGATALLPTTPATPPAAACFRDRSSGAKSETWELPSNRQRSTHGKRGHGLERLELEPVRVRLDILDPPGPGHRADRVGHGSGGAMHAGAVGGTSTWGASTVL